MKRHSIGNTHMIELQDFKRIVEHLPLKCGGFVGQNDKGDEADKVDNVAGWRHGKKMAGQ